MIVFFCEVATPFASHFVEQGNCVSGAAPALWAALCHSADWQVRRQVTDNASLSTANGRAGRWGRIIILLPGQPPLNECVSGMQPDVESYIRGWRAGVRLWRGSEKGSHRERDFSHCTSKQDTRICHICNAQKVFVDRIFWQKPFFFQDNANCQPLLLRLSVWRIFPPHAPWLMWLVGCE